MDKEQQIEAERKELNLLIDNGVNITVERTCYVKQKGIIGYFKKWEKKVDKLKFTIKEPTLSTLDRIASEQIELNIDEKLLLSDNALIEAKKLTYKHTRRMAKILALAVIGQDYIITRCSGSRIKNERDDKKLNELTDLFFQTIKPSLLIKYVVLVNQMNNYGDFTNSIRLMSASRTTMPILVEQED